MNKGWLELESDPGLFTLLLQDFGVKGVQVEEIYDLQKPIEGTTYGFIFLFRWIEERRSRRKNTISDDESFVKDDNVVNNIFFAQQMIPNSCASHALLSVLLNCEKVSLGETLLKLKLDCKNMNPENKGYAIGNIPELARAHNSHARQEPSHLPEKQQGMTVRRMEAFHFVSYVPIQGHLFELDGLKPYPIDHGPWDPTEDWTEKFRRVISERLGMATGGEPYHDIRFNLMAVVPDKVSLYEHKLSTLRTNRHIVLEALHQLLGDQEKMVRASNPNITVAEKEKCIAAVKKHGVDTGAMTINDLPLPSIKTEPSSSLSMGKFESQTLQTATSTQKSVAEVKHSEKLEVKEMKVKVEIPMEVDEVAVTTTSSTQPVAVTVASSTGSTQTPSKIETVSSVVSCAASSMTKSESNLSIPVVTVASSESGASTTLLAGSNGQTDVTQPLTIETKFSVSPGPSSESTDTASEVGSCFSSPSSSTFGNSAQNSPNVSCGEKDSPNSVTDGNTTVKSKTKFSSQQGFRPKDLIALFKNVENEIKVCETKLQDEQEKIKKYKIDDCRRSHNYDQFLCTFLSMLAEQGHLAELVQQHSLVKKRVPGHIGKLSKINQNDKRKRPKPKRRR